MLIRFVLFVCLTALGCSDSSLSTPTKDVGSDLDASVSDMELGGDLGDQGSDADMTASGVTCAPGTTGLAAPLPACTAESPCINPAGATVTMQSERPNCDTALFDEVASIDVDGVTRFACIRRAPGVTANDPRPLVLFFHPGGEGVTAVESTSLMAKTVDGLLSESDESGFSLVAIHGRRIRFGTTFSRDGVYHHDFYYRDLASPSTNPDVHNADLWIEKMVSEGIVDPKRIYTMGWSNGAFFSQLYSIARHETGTPNLDARVAASVVFAGGDPFHGIDSNPFEDAGFDPTTDGDDCQLTNYPSSDVPILLVYRTCDVTVSCGTADRTCWGEDRGYAVDTWLQTASDAGLNVTGFMINGAEGNGVEDTNAATCSSVDQRCETEIRPTGQQCLRDTSVQDTAYCRCLLNHLRWPDGNYPGGTMDREPGMLQFLRANPLP